MNPLRYGTTVPCEWARRAAEGVGLSAPGSAVHVTRLLAVRLQSRRDARGKRSETARTTALWREKWWRRTSGRTATWSTASTTPTSTAPRSTPFTKWWPQAAPASWTSTLRWVRGSQRVAAFPPPPPPQVFGCDAIFCAQALKVLKTAEFMPFVVFIAAPELDTLRAMHTAVIDAGLTTKLLTVRSCFLDACDEPFRGYYSWTSCFILLLMGWICLATRRTIWRRLWTRAPGSVGRTATTLTWRSSTTIWTRPLTRCRGRWSDWSSSPSGFPSAGSTDALRPPGRTARLGMKGDTLRDGELNRTHGHIRPVWVSASHEAASVTLIWTARFLFSSLCNSQCTRSVLIYWPFRSFFLFFKNPFYSCGLGEHSGPRVKIF